MLSVGKLPKVYSAIRSLTKAGMLTRRRSNPPGQHPHPGSRRRVRRGSARAVSRPRAVAYRHVLFWRRPTSVVYRYMPDADPRRVYHNVAIALDAARNLNNGHPSSLAMWLDALRLAPGESLLHIGCGVGYYTAIAALTVGSAGRVTAIEMDETLAGRARENRKPVRAGPSRRRRRRNPSRAERCTTRSWRTPASRTRCRTGWSPLAPGGRLAVLPITAAMPRREIGVGAMTLITPRGRGLARRVRVTRRDLQLAHGSRRAQRGRDSAWRWHRARGRC